jgi:hypothetical protein
MDYSDIYSNEPVSPSTVESNMAHNLHMTGRNVFEHDGRTYHVETDPKMNILHRHNAMTYYEGVYSWLIVAKEFGTDTIMFYLVKATDSYEKMVWVQVSQEFAETQFYC